MTQPKISIIVPCFNQAQFLDEALQSVLDQSYQDWECIIVNDGSPDNTEEIAQQWVNKDPRFKYIKKENEGISAARNKGIQEAKGTFILPLDADDKISSHYVKLAIQEFDKDDALAMVYCKAQKFGAESGPWELENYSLKRLAKINMIFCSGVYKRSDWEAVGGYDEKMVHGLEDWEFWIALLKSGKKVIQLDEVGFYYRVKEGSRNTVISKEQYKDLFDYMGIKHVDFYIEHIGNFPQLLSDNYQLKLKLRTLMTSKKHAVNVLFKSVFGRNLFKIKE